MAIILVIPLEPPSVNHYVKHTRSGRHYVTAEARAYKAAVAVLATDKVVAKAYSVSITVYQGFGSRGDVDNYAKVVLDSLVSAQVIHSDAAITDLRMSKRRDRENPRTEIIVRGL